MQLLCGHAVGNQEVGGSNPLALLHFPVNSLEAWGLRLRVSKIDFVPFLPFSYNKSGRIWQWGISLPTAELFLSR